MNLVLDDYNSRWILGKFAKRLRDELSALGHRAHIAPIIDRNADVNHFLNYNMVERSYGITSALITHLDDPYKLSYVRRLVQRGSLDYAICMSSYTAGILLNLGCDERKVRWSLPAVDELPPRRRIRIGLSGRVHLDGRKNEKWLRQVASTTDLQAFEFFLFGRGWSPTAASLSKAGAKTQVFDETENFGNDYVHIQESLQWIDHWMYLGFDEGAMGVLDAALAGVSLIATPQGFHLDLPNDIEWPVSSVEDLSRVLNELARPTKNLLDSSSNWTWRRYASDHLDIWGGAPAAKLSRHNGPQSIELGLGLDKGLLLRRAFSPPRVRSAIGRTHLARRVRAYTARKRS